MGSKIKILQINKFYHPVIGGIERVLRQIAEGLNDRADMKVLVCGKSFRGSEETINGVKVRRAGSLGVMFSMPISLSFFYLFLKLKKDRDVLHIHTPFPLADVAVRLFGFKGKIVLSWHSDVVRQKKLLFFYKPFLLHLLKRADLIIVATKGHIDHSDYLPAYRDKCVIIPYGADTFHVKKSEILKPTLKEAGEPVEFLFIGRLVYYKGCETLINAFARLKNANLTIIGDGPLGESLKKQVENLGVEEKICFIRTASDDELAEAYARCDVFVFPSVEKSEAFGLVQLEAMSYGKPVINTDLPSGVPYVSIDGVTGITVPPMDAESLAAAMKKLADDPYLRVKFGEAAYKRVRAEFNMETTLSHVIEQLSTIKRT